MSANRPFLGLVDVLEVQVSRGPERPFARFLDGGDVQRPGVEWDYGTLWARSAAVAARLQEVVAPGDRVLLMLPQGLDYIAAFFGCLAAGAIAVPAYPPDPGQLERTLPRLLAIAGDAEPTVGLTTDEFVPLAQALAGGTPELGTLRWLGVDGLPAAPAGWTRRGARAGSPAFLQYTSGSTRASKGVVVTHANLVAHMAMIHREFRQDHATMVSWLPMFHDMGLIGMVLAPIWTGSRTIYMSPIDFLRRPGRWLEAISLAGRGGEVISGGPDFAYALCTRKVGDADRARLDLGPWRLAFSGAEPVRAQTLDAFVDRFAPVGFERASLFPTYGLAEATLMASGGPSEEPPIVQAFDAEGLTRATVREGERRLVACGRDALDSEVVVVEPATGRPTEGVGEIWVRGPHVAAGYWGQPEESRRTFEARLDDGRGPFLRTGDLGFLRGGQLYVLGRMGDRLVIRGRNVHPEDVEATVEGADRSIRPGCAVVFAVEHGGEARMVVVAERTGADDAAALAARVTGAVSAAHGVRPWRVDFVAPRSLPKTSSGKRMRRAVRAAWLDGALAVHGEAPPAGVSAPATVEAADPARCAGGGVLGWLEAWMRERVGPASFDPAASFADHGIDSVLAAELAADLSDHLGRELPVELFFGRAVGAVAAELASGEVDLEGAAPLDAAALAEAGRLPEDIRVSAPSTPLDARWPTLFVTGATGFLGAWVLAELLERTEADLLCLVRAETPETALARIRLNLEQYQRWSPRHARRLRLLTGDLAEPRFGLSAERFAAIAGQLTGIVHGGARVDWVRSFAELAPVNVDGTREVLRLACLGGGVPVHAISSLGVHPIGTSSRVSFPEHGPLSEGHLLRLGYFQTKYVADLLLDAARARGLPVAIYRPGFITGDSEAGREPAGHGQLRTDFLAGCLAMGRVPRLSKALDVVPVDFVARAVVALMLERPCAQPAWVLLNPAPLAQDRYYDLVRRYGYALDAVPYGQWRDAVLDLPTSGDNPLLGFRAWYRALTPHQMYRLETLMGERTPVDDTGTRRVLDALGVRCPAFDAALVHTYLEAAIRRGRVPPPPGQRADAPLPRPMADERAPAVGGAAVDVTVFTDDYAEGPLSGLYAKAKARQWDAAEQLDWSIDLDPENPQELPDEAFPLFDSPVWHRMTRSERARLRHHHQAWQLSQFLHGEQGALLCASKLVQQMPTMDAKLCASMQVADEARHVEAFGRMVDEKLELRYPVCRPLERLLGDVIGDRRWDMTLLGMQVLVEGLALAAFATVRGQSDNPLVVQLNTYVMADEARHLAFGRLALAEHYPRLTDAERDEREAFVVEASYLLRDRFLAEDVWHRMGLPVADCLEHMQTSGYFHRFRNQLFQRIVPTIKAIGLWGPRVREAYGRMGVLGYAEVDLDRLLDDDRSAAAELLQAGRAATEVM